MTNTACLTDIIERLTTEQLTPQPVAAAKRPTAPALEPKPGFTHLCAPNPAPLRPLDPRRQSSSVFTPHVIPTPEPIEIDFSTPETLGLTQPQISTLCAMWIELVNGRRSAASLRRMPISAHLVERANRLRPLYAPPAAGVQLLKVTVHPSVGREQRFSATVRIGTRCKALSGCLRFTTHRPNLHLHELVPQSRGKASKRWVLDQIDII